MQQSLNYYKNDWESIAIPIVLILTGFVVLAAGGLGMLSLERMQNLWPLAVITIGLAELAPVSGPNR